MGNLINNFLRGLLLVVPIAAVIFIVWKSIDFLDSLIPYAKNIPGLSLVIVLSFITITGSLAKKYQTCLLYTSPSPRD